MLRKLTQRESRSVIERMGEKRGTRKIGIYLYVRKKNNICSIVWEGEENQGTDYINISKISRAVVASEESTRRIWRTQSLLPSNTTEVNIKR